MKICKIILVSFFIFIQFLSILNAKPVHFKDYLVTSEWCSYVGKVEINGMLAENFKDEVGVFVLDNNGKEILVGGCVIGDIEPDYYFVNIYYDDPSTEGIKDGVVLSDIFSFKIWDHDKNLEHNILPEKITFERDTFLAAPPDPPKWKDKNTFGFIHLEYNDTFAINSSADNGGKIFPNGSFDINKGETQKFVIEPDFGYEFQSISLNNFIIDEKELTILDNKIIYKIENINSNYKIIASFIKQQPPIALFNANPIKGYAPLIVSFNNQSMGNYTNQVWDFGDNSKSSLKNPNHLYSVPGKYNVTLTVKGPGGINSITKNELIEVNSPEIKIDFIANPKTGKSPLEVKFNAIIYDDYDELLWDFGDGTTGSGKNVIHKYFGNGKKNVSLKYTKGEIHKTITKDDYINIFPSSIYIQGRVTGNEEGLSNYIVEAWKDNKLIKHTITSEAGYYTISDIDYFYCIHLCVYPPLNEKKFLPKFYNNKNSYENADCLSTYDGNKTNINFDLTPIPTYGIKGRIIEGEKPLTNLSVNAFSNKLLYYSETITDENGYYTFTSLKASNDYIVSAFYNGIELFYESSIKSTSEKNQATPVSPLFPYIEDINIIFDNKGFIKGRIMTIQADGIQKPEPQAIVIATSKWHQTSNHALSDENGYYTISGLIPVYENSVNEKGYSVKVNSKNFPVHYYKNTKDYNDQVMVTTGSTNINFLIQTSSKINGNIVDYKTKAPITDAFIYCWSLSANTKMETTSDNYGNYTLLNLPNAKDYIVSVNALNYPIAFYNGRENAIQADYIDIRNGDVSNINFELDQGAFLSGHVYLSDGYTTVANVFVNAWSDTSNTFGSGLTKEDGSYIINGLQSDDLYILFAWHKGFEPVFYENTHDWEKAQKISPSDNEYNLFLSNGNTISGTILYNNNPVKDAAIEAWCESVKGWGIANSNNNGNYSISGLKSGIYDITVNHPHFMTQSKQVTLPYKQEIIFNLEPAPIKTISGTICNIEEKKCVWIRAWSETLQYGKIKSLIGNNSDQIAYTIDHLLPASDYIVELFSFDYPYIVYNNKYKWDEATPIDLTDNNASKIDFILEKYSSISGKIIFSYSGDAWINAFSKSLNISRSTLVKSNNKTYARYIIKGLPAANDYIVYVNSDKYQTLYYNNQETMENAQRLDLTKGDYLQIDFNLNMGVNISGMVHNNGTGVSGIIVEAFSDKTQSWGISNPTSSYGLYTIGGLNYNDEYIVQARKTDNAPFIFNNNETVRDINLASLVSTKNGNQENININIKQLYSISGTIRNKEQVGLSGIYITANSTKLHIRHGVYSQNDGTYEISGLPESDDYILSIIIKPELSYKPQTKTNIICPAINEDFVLFKGYEMSGLISNSAGIPISRAEITLWSNNNNFHNTDKTNNMGRFLIGGIDDANDYIIIINPSDDSQYISFKQDGIVIDANTPDESGVITKDFILNIGYSISGKVQAFVNNEYVPVENVNIKVFSNNALYEAETKTDWRGQYIIKNLPEASDYIITAIHKDYAHQKKTNQSSGSIIDFELMTGGIIYGAVMNNDGIIMPDTRIELNSQSLGIKKVSKTDINGNFYFKGLIDNHSDMIVDDYIITAYASGYPPQSVAALKVGDIVDFILEKSENNELNGTITDIDLKPPENVDLITIRVYDESNKYIKKAKADSNGNFNIKGLIANQKYKLKFYAKNSNLISPVQWAGENGVGVKSSNDAFTFSTQEIINFKYTGNW